MSDVVRIIPLGGLGEIGNNLCVVEQGERRILIDCGLSFPRDEMPGVDLVLPDFAYLREAPGGIDAVVLTHGHEDHIGALPYVMREIGVREVWGTRLTLGLVKSKLDEHGLLRDAEFIEIDPRGRPRRVRPVRGRVRPRHALGARRRGGRAAHHQGTILHTGDYKIDHTPIDGRPTDLASSPGSAPTASTCMLADSTNAERPGHHAVRAARRRRAQAHHPRRARAA